MKMPFDCYQLQQGFSAIAVVIILMAVGVILLTGFHQLINRWQKSIITERRYYLNFNQANSSLNWSTTQNWSMATMSWQCQIESNYQLKVCMKKSLHTNDNYVLVRGEYDQFYLYGLAHQYGEKLQFEKGHWLDYCPEKKSSDCE